jgi:hypothetical protein
MFELIQIAAKIIKVNPHTEKKDNLDVPACDIRLEVTGGNDLLSMFSPELKFSLYDRSEADRSDLIHAKDEGHRTSLRYPKMRPIKWSDEVIGAQVTLHYGHNDKTHVILDTCDVNEFEFECAEGGSVTLSFWVRCHHIDEKQGGRITQMVNASIPVSVIPPKADPLEKQAA